MNKDQKDPIRNAFKFSNATFVTILLIAFVMFVLTVFHSENTAMCFLDQSAPSIFKNAGFGKNC
jgi:hypothetical protein